MIERFKCTEVTCDICGYSEKFKDESVWNREKSGKGFSVAVLPYEVRADLIRVHDFDICKNCAKEMYELLIKKYIITKEGCHEPVIAVRKASLDKLEELASLNFEDF